jgi:2'-5' RNA ligase
MDFWSGIIVCFDDQSSKKLIELRKILNDTPDLNGRAFSMRVPLHITLFEHEELRKQEYYDTLESTISKYYAFSLEFSGFTTFPASHVFYLNPTYSSTLHSLRKHCLEALENQGLSLDRKPDSMWSPHVTLLVDLPTQEISKAVEISQDYLDLQITKPFIAKISYVEVFSYPPYKAEKQFFLHDIAD